MSGDVTPLPQLMDAVADAFADREAYVDGGQRVTFGQWLARANARPSVAKSAGAAAAVARSMTQVHAAIESGLFKREYRDHRLEWMIRSGGLDVVLEGLKKDNIRFSNELR